MKKIPGWVWAAAVLPRAALLIFAIIDPSRCLRGDSGGYLSLADNLLSYRIFSIDPGPVFSPETFRSPGYPVFLVPFAWIFRGPVLPIAFAQCAIGAAAVIIAWRWLKDSFGERAAAAGALALSLDLVTLFHTPIVLSETLYSLLLLVSIVLTWNAAFHPRQNGEEARLRNAVQCGLAWTAAAMVKPISLYLPIPLLYIWRRDKKSLAAFFLAAYFIPALWVVRNYHTTGHAIFSSVGGISLLRYPASGVESLRTGRPMGVIDTEMRETIDRAHPDGYASDADRAAAYSKAAVPIVKDHPILLARYWTWGIIKVLGGTGLEMLLEWTGSWTASEGDLEFRAEASGHGTLNLLRHHPVLIPIQILYLSALTMLYIFAILGLKKLWGAGRREEALFLAGCAAYFLILAGSQGYYRYRIPMMPFLAASAAAAIATPRKNR